MKYFYNKRLIYSPEKTIYFTDINKKFKFYTNTTGFKLLKLLLNNIYKMLELNKKKIKDKNLNFDKLIEKGKKIYIEKHNKNVQKKVGTWSIDEYKHLGMLHLYIKIKSFQRFTENFSIFEKADQLTPSLFKNINNDINVASIGGGPGFELVAFDFYFKHNSKHSDKNLNISFYNIDLVNDWNDYYSLNGNKYFFEQGDFFKLNIKKKMDYIIFSNTFGTYLNNEYGWNNIINLLKTAKAIFINDRNKNLNDFKNKILSNNLYFIEILGKNDHRQVIITKDKYIIPLQFNVIFKNVPYIR